MTQTFPLLDTFQAELERMVNIVREAWGVEQTLYSGFGLHGVYFSSDDSGDYAIIGFNLPYGLFAEIDGETYGEMNGIRFYKEDEDESESV